MDSKEHTIGVIKWLMKRAIFLLEEIDLQIDANKLADEQFTLDFYDDINKISIRK